MKQPNADTPFDQHRCNPPGARRVPDDEAQPSRGGMSNITLIGINHKTAPVSLREALAFSAEESGTALEALGRKPDIRELVIISTCNRMEMLFIPGADTAAQTIESFICGHKSIAAYAFKEAMYIHERDHAIRHLFRVACSLDSMVIGEPQILGQVKQAYRRSVEKGTSGVILNRLMHKAFSIAKKVRRETGIGDSAVSISYAATELAGKIFSDIAGRKVMLLGAGEMAELAVEHLMAAGVSQIVVANRTFANAVTLAEKFRGTPVRFEEMERFLSEVDIIISSTGAVEYVLGAAQVKTIMKSRKNRPLFFIDIAVPRDLDPEINRISSCFLYDIDDLQGIVDENMGERQKEALKGERLVDEAVLKFNRWMDSLKVVPTIKAIRCKIDDITKAEMDRTLGGMTHLTTADQAAIERMIRSMSDKIMHDPIRFLKNMGNHRDDNRYINAARHLFNLDPEDMP